MTLASALSTVSKDRMDEDAVLTWNNPARWMAGKVPDTEKDLALSRHVLHVHRFLKNPKQVSTPLPPSAFKQYIAAARTLSPSIPKSLTAQIVEQYVDMRSSDASASAGGHSGGFGRSSSSATNQAVMTARQLLSTLRLSQALARLRLSNTVNQDDVSEAIRLTYSSKASLLEEASTSGGFTEDVLSAIFNIVKDFADQRGLREVGYAQVEAMVTKKGFAAASLERCLQEYEELGVITVDSDRSSIHF